MNLLKDFSMRKKYIIILLGVVSSLCLYAQKDDKAVARPSEVASSDICLAEAVVFEELFSVSFPVAGQLQWYKYEASREMEVMVEVFSNTVEVEGNIYGGSCKGELYEQGILFPVVEGRKMVQRNLYPGDIFFVGLSGEAGETVSVRFSEVVEEEGSSCGAPIPLADEEVIELMPDEEKYFRYIPAISGIARITISNAEMLAVRAQEGCDMIDYIPEYDSPIAVAAGEPLMIYVRNWNETGKESFSIRTTASAVGETCENPFNASIGANNLSTTEGKYWYAFTPSKNCVVRIIANSALVNSQTVTFDVFESCNAPIGMAPIKSEERYATYRMNGGQTYLIEWTVIKSLQGSNIEFVIEEITIEEGDFCDLAIPVTVGITFGVSAKGDKWYSFVAPESGRLEMENDWTHDVVPFLKEHCDSYSSSSMILKNGKYEYSVTKGVSYRLCINNGENNPVQIKWQMATQAQGDNCDNPLALLVDEEVEIAANSAVWYKATIPQDGEYIVIGSFGFGADVNVKLGNCEATMQEGEYDYDLNANVLSLTQAKGDELLVQVKSMQAKGTLILYQIKRGDLRSDPIVLTGDGNVSFEATPQGFHWYEFTANSDSLFISSAKSGLGTAVRFVVYDADDVSLFTNYELVTDEDGNYLGYNITADKELVTQGAKYQMMVSGSKTPFEFYFATPLRNGIKSTCFELTLRYDRDSRRLTINNTGYLKSVITLYSMNGNTAGSWTMQHEGGEIDLSVYARGNYLVEIIQNEQRKVLLISL